jgi:hypothetical protein
MLDGNNNQKTTINTPATGIIQRSSAVSYFLRFHHNSNLAKELFEPNPEYNKKTISILQMMLIADGYILAECINIEK